MLECRFFAADGGAEPVRDWLKGLDANVRKEIGSDLQAVQWQWPVGPPLVGPLGDGLYEVRTSFHGNAYRVLFVIEGSAMVLLNGFVKKTQKTPKRELDLAKHRKSELENER